MQKNCSRFFENLECEYYPCHEMEQINCLFCFCPLYLMEDCGGEYGWITGREGRKIKDCSRCAMIHRPEGYAHVLKKITKPGR